MAGLVGRIVTVVLGAKPAVDQECEQLKAEVGSGQKRPQELRP